MSFKPEPAIQSCYTGQQIHWFESCQLTWMSELNTDCIEYRSDDVIKMKFVKLWDLLRYSERTTPKTPTRQKLAIRAKLSPRY